MFHFVQYNPKCCCLCILKTTAPSDFIPQQHDSHCVWRSCCNISRASQPSPLRPQACYLTVKRLYDSSDYQTILLITWALRAYRGVGWISDFWQDFNFKLTVCCSETLLTCDAWKKTTACSLAKGCVEWQLNHKPKFPPKHSHHFSFFFVLVQHQWFTLGGLAWHILINIELFKTSEVCCVSAQETDDCWEGEKVLLPHSLIFFSDFSFHREFFLRRLRDVAKG